MKVFKEKKKGFQKFGKYKVYFYKIFLSLNRIKNPKQEVKRSK